MNFTLIKRLAARALREEADKIILEPMRHGRYKVFISYRAVWCSISVPILFRNI